jgi:hypothetical protein
MIERVRINENAEANSKKSASPPRLPLLLTESAVEFEAVQDRVEREIKPHGIVEEIYLADFNSIGWEILRVRRCKVTIINTAFRSALETLLKQLLLEPGQDVYEVEDEAGALAHDWFTDQKAKIKVSEVLDRFGLDESAIEAEAIRRSASDLELLDRMLTSLESRRNKALRCIAEYRFGLAQQLRESADQIIDGSSVPRLEDASPRASMGPTLG